MKKSVEKWLMYIVIGELLVMLAVKAVAIAVVSIHILRSDPMDNGDTIIHSYPDKLYYVIGKDSVLDLAGGSLCSHPTQQDVDHLSCIQDDENCDYHHTTPMSACDYDTNIDFTNEGRYYVWFAVEYQKEEHILCAFPVDVIAPEAAAGKER